MGVGLEGWFQRIKKQKSLTRKKLERQLINLNKAIPTNDVLGALVDTKPALNMEADKDELYWEQRARANWLNNGDRNTKFFYQMAMNCRWRNRVKVSVDSECIIYENNVDLLELATNYFNSLFTSKGVGETSAILEGIEPCITQLMKEDLEKDFTSEEVSSPRDMTQFRPISLCNILYKIISKMLANRLQKILHLCIDEAQSAFVPGRFITNNIIVAYEILHSMKRKRVGSKGPFALKLDMSKAYDRVEWRFVQAICQKMGFSDMWVENVMRCVSSVSYSVVMNGEVGNMVFSSRGLRQGDVISPYLFLICSKGLSTLLQMAATRVFGATVIMDTLENRREEVCRILGVGWSNNPEKYLGLPAIVPIPLYTMNCFLLPSTVCKELEVILARFWWQKKTGRRGLHWCAWKELSVPKEEGGMGFCDLSKFNIALLAKQGWRIMKNPSSLIRIGARSSVPIWKDYWLPGNDQRLITIEKVAGMEWVSDLILQNPNRWNRDIIYSIFTKEEVDQIVSIPIPTTNQSDKVVWFKENSGIYSVKSGYKLLLDPPSVNVNE
ncbi:hypothetical protein PVK06_035993 [Gossypium arboreum]|uniref:Reverse transcriptase domain-containing protein n=1 Tax=Gossypium arboreum TaxID=29729 RepID=A0ABR0NJF0_GOSAR|nr:hypothetical protein PVK06_035993 [Gossypium arboreum]